MKIYLISLLLCFISEREQKSIEEILKYANLEKEDLSFNKDLSIFTKIKDSLTLYFLKDPLFLPEYSQKIEKVLREIKLEKEKIENLFYLASLKNLNIKQKNYKSFKKFLEIEYKNLNKAKNLIESSFSNISFSQRETLICQIPILFTDEDDKKDDTLLCILNIEKSKNHKKWKLKKLARVLQKINFKNLKAGIKIGLSSLLRIVFYIIDNKESIKDTSFSTPFGDVVINRKKENNIYKGENYFVIVDMYGNDIYRGRPCTGSLIFSTPFSILIDFNGNDIYNSEKFLSICSSFLGISILIDKKGNDSYNGSMHSICSSVFGLSFMWDEEGKDNYISDFFSQSASFFGYSFLIDLDGDDIFKSTEFSQSFSSTKGISFLIDKRGEDSFISYGKHFHKPLLKDETRSFSQGFSMGLRPLLGGGVSILFNGEGNDVYYAETFGQGCAYWYGTGILIDNKGNDLYHLAQYGQGAGIHIACGGLFDIEGDDEYISRYGPAQGEGHDYSVGVLVDKRGDDKYIISGGQGVGLNSSVGIFIESDGNDIYLTTEKFSQGSGKRSRGKVGIGIFMDLKGKDKYKGEFSLAEESYIWVQGEIGIGIDPDTVEVKEKVKIDIDTTVLKNLDIDSLFKIASEWGVGEYREIVKKARKYLAKRGKEAIYYIEKNKMNTLKGLELRAIKKVLKENPKLAEQMFSRTIKSDNDTIRLNTVYLIGETKAKKLENILFKLLEKEKDIFLKSRIIITLGKIECDSFNKLVDYFKYRDFEIRIALIRAAKNLKKKEILKNLLSFLYDKRALIRFGAEKILKDNAKIIEKELIEKTEKESSEKVLYHLLRIISNIRNKEKAKEIYLKFTKHKVSVLRGIAINNLIRYNNSSINAYLKTLLPFEKDPFVKKILKRIYLD